MNGAAAQPTSVDTGERTASWQVAAALPDGVVLRNAVRSDLPVLAEAERALFGAEAWSLELLRAELDASGAPTADRCYLVVQDEGGDGTLLGYCGLWFGDGVGDADLLTIATVPRARRRGLASLMLETVLGVAERVGCGSVLLEVRGSNEAAQRLYASHGFEVVGTRRRYYSSPAEDALVMIRRLREPVAPGVVGAEVR